MKKHFYLFLLVLFFGKPLMAQMEVKANLYGFFYDVPYVSTEFFMGKNFGLEIGTGFIFKNQNNSNYEKKSMSFITAKYYLGEHKKDLYDNTFVGLFISSHMDFRIASGMFNISNKEPSLVVGGMIGRKWMYTERLFMEANLGLGMTYKKITYEPSDLLIFFNDPIKKKFKTDVFLSFVVGYRFLR